jgi:hypothetical protein
MNSSVCSRKIRLILGLAPLAALATLIGPGPASGSAPDYWPNEVCSNQTLHGVYGFTVTGIRPAAPGGPQVPIAGVAITTFEGNGSFTQIDNINVNGVGVVPDRPGSGSYGLNPDCSGWMTLTNGPVTLELSIVVVDHGREVRTAVLNPGVIVTSNGRRI